MKNFLMLITVTILLFSCSNNGSIVELNEGGNHITFVTTEATSNAIIAESKYENKEVGEFIFDLGNPEIELKGILEFPGYSILEQNEISVSIQSNDMNFANIDLVSQNHKLHKPICLTLKYSGLLIKEGDVINFNSINEEGEFKDIEYGRLIVDYDSGWALVVKAKIYQFSQVGFTIKEN